jgi:hypothetical protein
MRYAVGCARVMREGIAAYTAVFPIIVNPLTAVPDRSQMAPTTVPVPRADKASSFRE